MRMRFIFRLDDWNLLVFSNCVTYVKIRPPLYPVLRLEFSGIFQLFDKREKLGFHRLRFDDWNFQAFFSCVTNVTIVSGSIIEVFCSFPAMRQM